MANEVAVVGAGVVGLLAARALARQGWKVSLLDAGDERPSASWAAGGILSPLCPWRSEAAVSQLTDMAVARYQQLAVELLAEGCLDPEVDACGLLATAEPDMDKALQWCQTHGFTATLVSTHERQPGLTAKTALYVEGLGTIRNPRLLKSLVQSLQRLGVQRITTQVQAMATTAGGWQLQTKRGIWHADAVLVAAGAWTTALLMPFGVHLPIRPVKGQIALFRFPEKRLHMVVIGDKSYLVPRRDGSVLAGSTLEENPEHMCPDRAGAELLTAKWRALWPLLGEAVPVAHWAGFRPGNVSDVPFIGEVPGAPGLFVCAGHYRDGICAAPASVELLVAQMTGKPLPFMADAYALPSASSSLASA